MTFNIFGKRPSTKAIPANAGLSLESYVMAPKTLQNNPEALIALNKGYVWTCNRINSSTVASCKYKLFTTSTKGQKSLGDWISTAYMTNRQKQWIKQSVNHQNIRTATEIIEIVDHPFLDLMEAVANTVDSFTLLEITEQYLGLIGNAFWYVRKDGSGQPIDIEVLPAEYVMVKMDVDNKIIGYREQINGTGYRREFEKDEILHFKQPAPGAFRRIAINLDAPTGLYGMGSLEACLDEARLMESINTYEKALMDNNGRPDFVVKYMNGQLEEKQMLKLTKQWNQIFRGFKNAGKVSIMDNQFEIQEMGFNPKDMQYLEGKKWLRTSISNAFGVQETFLSTENANRASSETSIEQYYRFTILPKLRRMQEVINSVLLPMYDDNLWMCFDDPVPENYDAVIRKETADISLGIISINELRVSRGLDPYPDAKYDMPIHATNKVDTSIQTDQKL